MERRIEIPVSAVKELLRMHVDATTLLEEIPRMQDEGRLSEASQHIGAELEARNVELDNIQEDNHAITQLLEEINNEKVQGGKPFEQLEKDILGENQ